jgi:hypothetical protein
VSPPATPARAWCGTSGSPSSPTRSKSSAAKRRAESHALSEADQAAMSPEEDHDPSAGAGGQRRRDAGADGQRHHFEFKRCHRERHLRYFRRIGVLQSDHRTCRIGNGCPRQQHSRDHRSPRLEVDKHACGPRNQTLVAISVDEPAFGGLFHGVTLVPTKRQPTSHQLQPQLSPHNRRRARRRF